MPWIEIWGDGPKQDVELDTFPKTCPYCDLWIDAAHRTASFFDRSIPLEPSLQTYLEVVFQCPSQDCSRLFIALYEIPPLQSRGPFVLAKTVPATSHTRVFDAFVKDVSPAFCDIWNQAYQAEQAGLAQICGMGYRKAVEFLVKDYLVRQKPHEESNIQNALLGACISKHIDDPRIRACAKRAAWLGNDETHSLRKWEGKDVKDLKTLIDLTVHWMLMHHLTAQYEGEMGESKPCEGMR